MKKITRRYKRQDVAPQSAQVNPGRRTGRFTRVEHKEKEIDQEGGRRRRRKMGRKREKEREKREGSEDYAGFIVL